MTFRFELLAERHLHLLTEWFARPHVAAWWGKPPSISDVRAEYLTPIGEPSAALPYIAFDDGVPVGYIQSYRAMGSKEGWWENESDPDVLGIDQFLADEDRLGKGLGTRMIAAFVEQLLADPKVTRIQVDPAPTNARAIRCYEKVGFERIGEIITPDGPALLMTLQRRPTNPSAP
jgi:RimJ/RimL family protein N-acetyltransferase